MESPKEGSSPQTADQIVAEAIVRGLLAKGLIRQDKVARLGERIASGSMTADDWGLEVELGFAKSGDGE